MRKGWRRGAPRAPQQRARRTQPHAPRRWRCRRRPWTGSGSTTFPRPRPRSRRRRRGTRRRRRRRPARRTPLAVRATTATPPAAACARPSRGLRAGEKADYIKHARANLRPAVHPGLLAASLLASAASEIEERAGKSQLIPHIPLTLKSFDGGAVAAARRRSHAQLAGASVNLGPQCASLGLGGGQARAQRRRVGRGAHALHNFFHLFQRLREGPQPLR